LQGLEDEYQLIQGCIANNRQAQEKLYRLFYPALILLCKRFFMDDHSALETVNDGMMKVYKHISRYDSSKGDFFNWVYTVVRNTALDKIRLCHWPATIQLIEEAGQTYADNPLKTLEEQDIYKLLDTLAPATRVVCSLYYLEGFSIRDIMAKLELSSGTVKWHLSETRKKLKPVLEKYYS
jgi:RNA polymerase sigma factor (sigma-70 family)